MPIELGVPKYEREERGKRFQALDAISELASKDDRRSERFDYGTNTLAETIISRSQRGDGVCRNLDIALLGSGSGLIEVCCIKRTDETLIGLDVLRTDGKPDSHLNLRFDGANRFVDSEYRNENGDGTFDWTWPAFTTDVLGLLEEDLQNGRESWAEKLRLKAGDYYKKFGVAHPVAVEEIKALIHRMEDRSDHYAGGELFVFGQPVSMAGDRLKIDLVASFPEAARYLEILDRNYGFRRDVERTFQYEYGNMYGHVYNLAFCDFDIAVHEVQRIAGNASRIAQYLVEEDFRRFLVGETFGEFGTGRFNKGQGVLLEADPVESYPIFRDE